MSIQILPVVLQEFALQNSHPPIDFNAGEVVLANDWIDDVSAPYIQEWNLPWSQPSEAELLAVEQSAIDRKNDEELLIAVETESLDRQIAVGDPL